MGILDNTNEFDSKEESHLLRQNNENLSDSISNFIKNSQLFNFDNIDISFDKIFNFAEFWYNIQNENDLNIRKIKYIEILSLIDMMFLEEELDEINKKMYTKFRIKAKNAIEHIDALIDCYPELKSDVEKNTNKNQKNIDFTTKRQVLAIYYLLNEVDKKTNLIDRTIRARFIEFLTGKNYDAIYDKLSEPHKGLDNNNNKNAISDMKYVKEHFNKLGLINIVEQISKDMNI